MSQTPKRLSRDQKTNRFKQLWTYYRGWKWLIFLGLLFVLMVSSSLVFLAKTTSVDTLQDALKSETLVLDDQDQVAGSLSAQKGNYVSLDQISSQMRQTVVTTEDKRFYEHNGFDTIGMGRAFVRLLINRDTSGGGGSTITQQLAKNAFLTQDQTIQRKLKEFFLALEIEKAYTKDEILEMYLNHAYFGNGVWGVEDASMKYFGHSAATLDWNESAVLTGILKGPSLYNPIDDYEAAIDRRNVVLSVMDNEDFLDSGQVQDLSNSPIYVYDAYWDVDDYTYPHYFDAVINEALELTNIPEADIQTKGYRIYTHLNQGYQQALEASYDNNVWLFPDDETGEPLVQSASVVVDPNDGGVAAVYGGRGDYVYRGFNRATDMYRSPGSTIKPLAVYLPALEAGYTVHSMVPDVVQGYGPDHYTPQNYNHYTEPSGETPLYYALAQSKNTSAVYLMDELGIDRSVKKLRQFGIEVPKQDQSLTLALGAMSQGVTPLELANAYSAFANEGVRYESFLIRRIEDATGKTIYSNERPARSMVMTKNRAYDMTSMMLDSYGGYGTGYGAGPDYGLLAGKTGSTEEVDGSENTRDRWMVGYTPDFVIATWMGLDEIGEVSLDEIMPTGMTSLFNSQTSNLMALSPQTPFTVAMASAMTEETNYVEDIPWYDEAGQVLDQANYWVQTTLPIIWHNTKTWANQAYETVSGWLANIRLPF